MYLLGPYSTSLSMSGCVKAWPLRAGPGAPPTENRDQRKEWPRPSSSSRRQTSPCTFGHRPRRSLEAVKAQSALPEIQGKRGLWFCGAWQRNGFHEDGLWSAVRVVEAKGVEIPWR